MYVKCLLSFVVLGPSLWCIDWGSGWYCSTATSGRRPAPARADSESTSLILSALQLSAPTRSSTLDSGHVMWPGPPQTMSKGETARALAETALPPAPASTSRDPRAGRLAPCAWFWISQCVVS